MPMHVSKQHFLNEQATLRVHITILYKTLLIILHIFIIQSTELYCNVLLKEDVFIQQK